MDRPRTPDDRLRSSPTESLDVAAIRTRAERDTWDKDLYDQDADIRALLVLVDTQARELARALGDRDVLGREHDHELQRADALTEGLASAASGLLAAEARVVVYRQALESIAALDPDKFYVGYLEIRDAVLAARDALAGEAAQ